MNKQPSKQKCPKCDNTLQLHTIEMSGPLGIPDDVWAQCLVCLQTYELELEVAKIKRVSQ